MPPDAPHVAILVPAKDEGPRIAQCIESILKQDYPHFSVIAINDRSTDDTGRQLDAQAARNARVRVVHIESLPPGWLGKCHALWSGAKLATMQTGSSLSIPMSRSHRMPLRRLYRLRSRKYDVLTVLTALECHTFLERLILPLAAAAWSIMHTISLTNDDNRPEIATANGQFLLIRRDVYESVGGHEAVKDRIVEDVELVRLLKSQDRSIRFFSGAHLRTPACTPRSNRCFTGGDESIPAPAAGRCHASSPRWSS